MRRLSSLIRRGEPSPPELPPSDSIREAPSAPPPNSWRVDDQFLEETSRLVPASPDDVSDETKAIFYAKVFSGPNEWVDLDYVEFGLGTALGIFPHGSSFEGMKWVFWTENALGTKLSNLVQALARPDSECLESRTFPDFQFRKLVQ